MATLYQQDVIAWPHQQAALPRAGRFSELDLERVAEEIADVGKADDLWWEEDRADGAALATEATGLVFPEACLWAAERVMAEDFWPES